MDKYDEQAQAFLEKFAFTVKIAEGDARCPPWDAHKRGCMHGDQYRVTVRGKPRRSLPFDWWGSLNMAQNSIQPRAYNILATLSSEGSMPTDADEVAEEFGSIPPSQAIAIAKFARRVQRFFSEAELDALSAIQ